MRAICPQSARTIAAAILLVCSGAESADLYLTVGAGIGESGMAPRCSASPHQSWGTGGYSAPFQCEPTRVRGTMVDVEIGVERGGWALFLDHASNPTTDRDIGATTLGVRYQIRKRL